jgi:hypothetical protein
MVEPDMVPSFSGGPLQNRPDRIQMISRNVSIPAIQPLAIALKRRVCSVNAISVGSRSMLEAP